MQREAGFFGSSIGKKVVMAVTGVMLVGFVFAHMAGNMQLYIGAHALDGYGEMLHTMLHGAGIWIARAALLGAVVLHIWAAVGLTRMNNAARGVGYREVQHQKSTFASRWMRVSGVVLLVFIVFHLLHFTTGTVHPDFVEGAVYHNVVAGFSVPWVSGFYIVAMLCLAAHLYHGVWSMLQTLGLSHPRYLKARKALAAGVTVLVVGANISFPIAVLTGFVR